MSPVIDVARIVQEEYGNINLDYGKFGNIGLFAAQVCVDATTRKLHTKFDQGPTLITISDQQYSKENRYKFSFLVN